LIRPIHLHAIDLVALKGGASRLEDEALAVRREVRLGIGATEGELANVPKVSLGLATNGIWSVGTSYVHEDQERKEQRDECTSGIDDHSARYLNFPRTATPR
jgi:hypothetical protein